ncbi:sigma-70 family RNA polymerase sigma factor [Microbispora bryophytorum]|nr:sigma-70 family RNA polymerase sigma factor [Microbispora bryophytorum]MBD3135685.1 sigma-70 family RNA polymerase sigma factor [Microbispora bryophytorum]TQS09852.1 sigma-70 family RNA polymerase sigma factor [Microbispora bryophytorum]
MSVAYGNVLIMTVDTPLARLGEPGLHQVVARVLRQLRSSAVNGAVPPGVFEDAAEQMRLTPEARERVVAALADMGLRVVVTRPTATVARSERSERALALVRQHIPTGHVTREQLSRFGRLAGLDAEEIASLPERAKMAGIVVLHDEPVSSRPEPASPPGREPEPAPESDGRTYDFPQAVAVARHLINGDRLRTNPGRRLLSATEEVGLSILLRGGVDRAGVEPTDEELSALPADDIRRVARNAFVLHNTRLVYSIIVGYLGQGLEEEDLVQHGILGLIRAARKFDPRKGHKFSTYATWWIRQTVIRAIADEGAAIRIPVHMHEKMRMVAATESALRRAGKSATAVDVALATGLDVRAVEEARALSKVTDSLDRIIGDGANLGDFLSLPDPTPGPEERLQEMLSEEAVEEWLAPLSEKEADILRRHLGLDDDEPQTLEQIGHHYGVTRERIRQIEAKALEQIRERLPEELRERIPAHLRKRSKKKA